MPGQALAVNNEIIFTNIVGQDGILQRIGNPLGLRTGIDQADCQSAAD
jgi:hypothetical protein